MNTDVTDPVAESEPHTETRPRDVTGRRRLRAGSIGRHVRRTVLRAVLVPGLVLVLLWAAGAGYLVYQGLYLRGIAVSVRQISIPALAGLTSIEKERTLSMALLAGSSGNRPALASQRRVTDHEFDQMRARVASSLAAAPSEIKTRMAGLLDYVDRLPAVRAKIDAGTTDREHTYAFYNSLLDSAVQLFYTQARITPDVRIMQGGLYATQLFRLGDLMSRAGSQASTAFAVGKFDSSDYLAFTKLVGAYQDQLRDVSPSLLPQTQAGVRDLLSSGSWKQLNTVEDALVARGPWKRGVPPALRTDGPRWNTLAGQVSDRLIALAKQQADLASAQAQVTGGDRLLAAIAGSVGALLVIVLALFWGVRQASVLTNRTLVPRIRQLGTEANTAVQVHLPAILRRLVAGEQVDARTALLRLDELGRAGDSAERDGAEQSEDEIDKVARVLNQAMAVAVDAAIRESEARAGAQKVFLGIAYRNQKPLQQALTQLDAWEQTEQDADRLDQWFKIHYLVTQVRGVTESLIILGGGQPGRRWRNPVLLRDVLRSAISQANQYPRIRLEMAPEAYLSGSAVAGTIHLITQLLNNAVEFSSPTSPVKVRGMRVASGAVVEIEDHGVGMPAERRDQVNAMLREAPDFNVTALRDGSQLGFWVVAHLAKRLNIRIELRDSPYGGLLVIALLPATLLVEEGREDMPREPRAPEQPSGNGEQAPAAVHAFEPAAARLGAAPEPADVAPRWNADPPSEGGRHAQEPVPTASRGRSPRAAERPASTASGRPALPERSPQQHLAPQLRERQQPSGDTAPDLDTGSPDDDTRARLAAFQRGTRAGRADD